MTTYLVSQANASPSIFAERASDQLRIWYRVTGQHVRRDFPGLSEIVLADEVAQQLRFPQVQVVGGTVVARAQQASLSNRQHRDAQRAGL